MKNVCLNWLEYEGVIIVGPTACGKTGLAEELLKFDCVDVINADSKQMLQYVDAGVAMPAFLHAPERYHLFKFLEPEKEYSSAAFRQDVEKVVSDLHANSRVPIVVGGTLFYIKNLLFKRSDVGVIIDEEIVVEAQALLRDAGVDLWRHFVQRVDPLRAVEIMPGDAYRWQRAVDLIAQGVLPSGQKEVFSPAGGLRWLVIYLYPPSLGWLKQKIVHRLESECWQGWLLECQRLQDQGILNAVLSHKPIGYWEVSRVLKKEISQEAAKQAIIDQTYDYARRQIKFFRWLKKQLSGQINVLEVSCAQSASQMLLEIKEKLSNNQASLT